MVPVSFSFSTAGRIVFGRGKAALVAPEAAGFGRRVLLVRGRSVSWVDELADQLIAQGCIVTQIHAQSEPDLDAVTTAIAAGRDAFVELVVAVGGGAVIDLGKAAAALIPGAGTIMDHLEVVGLGKPLTAPPLPMIAVPTTAGTGAEVTKNAVISVPEFGRKVSLRDPRMLPDLAIIDPALTDHSPAQITLAAGLDAITQVIEPFLSSRATPLTDALCQAAIPSGLAALSRLYIVEDPDARDAMAFTSLCGGLALANSGLGAVHGLAGVIGGRFGAPHGLICGRLLGPVLAANHKAIGHHSRFDLVANWIAEAFDLPVSDAFSGLGAKLDHWDLPRLGQWIGQDHDLDQISQEAAASSSMQGNPCVLPADTLSQCLRAAL